MSPSNVSVIECMKTSEMPVFSTVKSYCTWSSILPTVSPPLVTSIAHKSKSAKAKSLSSAVKDCEERVLAWIDPKQGVSPINSVMFIPNSVNPFWSILPIILPCLSKLSQSPPGMDAPLLNAQKVPAALQPSPPTVSTKTNWGGVRVPSHLRISTWPRAPPFVKSITRMTSSWVFWPVNSQGSVSAGPSVSSSPHAGSLSRPTACWLNSTSTWLSPFGVIRSTPT